ncbi:MAG: GAF domain-containing protein [Leptolyngbyaceae cyanobacterium SL_7_1]|nr:GAF domain-containing protein [Leptolyngbyaceae cyanobacterium SL_7_1]
MSSGDCPARSTDYAHAVCRAIAQNRCIYYADYPAAPNAAAVLVAQGVRSVAVLPLLQVEQVRGAIVLFWYRPVQVSPQLQGFFASLLGGMQNLLRFQDGMLRLDNLQARLRAILETIPQGVVFGGRKRRTGMAKPWGSNAARIASGGGGANGDRPSDDPVASKGG